MLNKKDLKETIAQMILEELSAFQLESHKTHVPVSISARHLHLSREDLDALFGKGYELTVFKEISQPGQYAAEEKVTLVTEKGVIENVRVLGPVRSQTQIELAQSECRSLGIKGEVRNSGDLAQSAGITLVGPKGRIHLKEGVIIPDRHIHMTPKDAEDYGVRHGEKVRLYFEGKKGGCLDEVTIRVADRYKLDVHLDTDDANAFQIQNGTMAKLVKKGEVNEIGNR